MHTIEGVVELLCNAIFHVRFPFLEPPSMTNIETAIHFLKEQVSECELAVDTAISMKCIYTSGNFIIVVSCDSQIPLPII